MSTTIKWINRLAKKITDLNFLIEVEEIIVSDIDFINISNELIEINGPINKNEYTFDRYNNPIVIYGVTIITQSMKRDEIMRNLPQPN